MREVLNTQRIFFKSGAHRERFLAIMQQLGKMHGNKYDEEYASALYILTADFELWEAAIEYVARTGIDIDEMLKENDLGEEHTILANLAGNLFNGNQHLEPVALYDLSDENFVVALEALQLRRHGYPMM